MLAEFINLIKTENQRIDKQPKKRYTETMTEDTERIIAAIKAIPRGRVSCYRDVALSAGLSGNGARQVARVLHSMSEKYGLPWWRVIRADGTIALRAGEGAEQQAELLRQEGVTLKTKGEKKHEHH
jgi:methylated-DNA-protein-cysteine methyltransferase-like protein